MTRAYIALVTGIVLIGLSPILIKMADAPGIVTSFYRLGIGAATLALPFIYNIINNKIVFTKRGVSLAFIGGMLFAGDMALWTTGIVSSNATLPTIVANISPLWVGLGAIYIFKERQKLGFWLGVLLAIAGMVLLVSNDIFQSNHIVLKGIFYGLIAGMFYAGYQMITQAGRKSMDTLSYLFISSASSTIFLAAMVQIFGYTFFGYSQKTWVLWLIMGVGLQAGAWFLINFAQGYITASVVSPSLLLQPMITGIIAVSFLGEMLTWWHITGGIIILAGIYIVHFNKRKGM